MRSCFIRFSKGGWHWSEDLILNTLPHKLTQCREQKTWPVTVRRHSQPQLLVLTCQPLTVHGPASLVVVVAHDAFDELAVLTVLYRFKAQGMACSCPTAFEVIINNTSLIYGEVLPLVLLLIGRAFCSAICSLQCVQDASSRHRCSPSWGLLAPDPP